MRLTFSHWTAALCALAIVATPCGAVIKKLTPLKEVVEGTKLIFTAEVEKIDADKPSMTLQFKGNLKGKFEIESLPVNLKGDSFAKKDDHAKVMLDRLAIGRKLILFATKEGKTYQVFGYLEGTWFQMQGSEDADGKAVRWAFLHCAFSESAACDGGTDVATAGKLRRARCELAVRWLAVPRADSGRTVANR